MNIGQMRVAIRPMSTAQAVDLGTMMARHWFVPLWKIWMGMALPFFIVLYLPFLLYGIYFDSMIAMFGGFLFWLCKPIYEKPMVTWLGHALFNEEKEIKTTVKEGLKQAKTYSFTLLFKKRLSPNRQLILPILQLEKPDKVQLSQRLPVLLRGQSSGLTWQTIILVHIEGFIPLAVLLVITALIPTSFMKAETYFAYLEYSAGWEDIVFALLYLLAASIIAPFFIAGGFAVYLTKRCLLEGWDVELVFKNLASRYQSDQSNPFKAVKHQDISHQSQTHQINRQQNTIPEHRVGRDGIS